MKDRVLAGVSEMKITPPVGMWLLGPVAPSTGVHDDLYARTLVLSNGKHTAAIVCLDLAGTDLSFSDSLRAGVRQRTGIATTLLNCTHTHSAPFTIPWCEPWEWFRQEGRAWREELTEKVTEAVQRASEGLRPATLRAGRAPARVGINRRLMTEEGVVMEPNRGGAIVPWVDVLRVDAEGEPMALLFSHAAHPVIVHAASDLISADYPGFAVAALRQLLGGGTLAMFAQGCGANINGEPWRGGFEAAENCGRRLGEAVATAAQESEAIPLQAARSVAGCALKIAAITVKLPFQEMPTAGECEAALARDQERLADAERAGQSEMETRYLRFNLWNLQGLWKRIKKGSPEPLRFEINALTIGDEWCLLTMPHEVFCEYQLWADLESPFRHTMTLGYTNGCESYVPTDADLALGHLGGYEAAPAPTPGVAALCYRQRTALKVGIEGQIKQGIVRLWGRLRSS